MSLATEIPQPMISFFLALVITYAILWGKHHRNIARTAFGSVVCFLFIAFSFSKEEVFENEILLYSTILTFGIFVVGSMVWVALDIVYGLKHKRL